MALVIYRPLFFHAESPNRKVARGGMVVNGEIFEVVEIFRIKFFGNRATALQKRLRQPQK
jgi:hypothetical protein